LDHVVCIGAPGSAIERGKQEASMDLARMMPFASVLGIELRDAAGRLVGRTTRTQAVVPGS
jgi:hypothetical protein